MHDVGTVLQGRYRVERLLGQGGMGDVYLATHVNLGVPCAIKTLQALILDPVEQEAFGRQFEQEARLLASLRHPHLARVTDFFEESGRAWLVMEFVPGATLGRVGSPPMSEERVLAVASQVLDALEYLHSRQPPVIVRDLKPDNLMQTPDGNVLLIDFGIAKVLEPTVGTATVVRHCGTRGFAPLEQYTDGGTDQRSDLYALGATLLCLLTGAVPPDPAERVTRQEPLPDPRNVQPGVTERTVRAIERLMAITPAERPASAAEARALLFPPSPPPGTDPAATAPVLVTDTTAQPSPARDTMPLDEGEPGKGSLASASHLLPTQRVDSLAPGGTPAAGAPGAGWSSHWGGRLTILAGIFLVLAICTTWGAAPWLRAKWGGSGARVKDASLLSVAWGAGCYVAVGSRGTILTSPDGATWIRRPSGTTGFLRAVARGRGQFVAVGDRGLVLTSADGATWDLVPAMTGDFLRSVTYGNGLFVAVGAAGTIITSADGLTWESHSFARGPALHGVAWGQGQFVAVGDEATIFTSPDGMNWTLRASGTTNPIQGVVHGGGLFVVVGDAGTVLTSSDGVNWVPHACGQMLIHHVTHGRGRFVAVTHSAERGAILTSPDAVTWTSQGTGARLLNDVLYADGQFVAVGVEFGVGNPSTVIMTSTDGTSWTDR